MEVDEFLREHNVAAMITVGTDGRPKVAKMEPAVVDGRLLSERATYELTGECEGWVEVGVIAGSVLDVDVDERLGPLDPDEVRFDAVRLVDDGTAGGTGGSSPGADIDAVEQLVFDAP